MVNFPLNLKGRYSDEDWADLCSVRGNVESVKTVAAWLCVLLWSCQGLVSSPGLPGDQSLGEMVSTDGDGVRCGDLTSRASTPGAVTTHHTTPSLITPGKTSTAPALMMSNIWIFSCSKWEIIYNIYQSPENTNIMPSRRLTSDVLRVITLDGDHLSLSSHLLWVRPITKPSKWPANMQPI